jgi:acetyl-CoA acyltransferase
MAAQQHTSATSERQRKERKLEDAYIVAAVRSPIGKKNGNLRFIRPDDLGALVVSEVVKRAGVEPSFVDDVFIGCASPLGEQGGNIGRLIPLIASFPVEVPGMTINRYCGSSLQAVNSAAHAVMAGDAGMIIAGGVESMNRVPMGSDIGTFSEKLLEKYTPTIMGVTAENVARRYRISRRDQDEFAYESHRKAVKAAEEGRFKEEIIPIQIDADGLVLLMERDEGPRSDTTIEKLASLNPVFDPENGTVTAGNSSGVNDGAAAVLVASESKVDELGLKPLAKFVGSATAGVHPDLMGTGPIPATRKVLANIQMTLDEIELVELHEAFAATALTVIRELGIETRKINPNGGAIALGHPLGCSGARIITTLVHEMQRRSANYGLATMCVGFGQGISTVLGKP